MTVRARLDALADRRRLGRLFVAALIAAGILFTFANPARTWSAQRREIVAARERNAVLDEQSRALQARADSLSSDSEVERLARRDYGLVKPGEEAFGILPAPGSAHPAPPPPPPPKPHSWWRTALDKLTFWD